MKNNFNFFQKQASAHLPNCKNMAWIEIRTSPYGSDFHNTNPDPLIRIRIIVFSS